jgi:predicted nuclease of predicted toxin-antitoxin system
MRIIIDECLPKRVGRFFPGHEVYTVPQIGLSGFKDGELLESLAKRGIDCFVTIDGNMEYQQRLSLQPFATIVVRSHSNRFADLVPLARLLRGALSEIAPGKIIHVPI